MHGQNANDSELAVVLESWLNEVVAIYKVNFSGLVHLTDMPRWYSDPDGGFRRHPYAPIYRYPALDEAIFKTSSTWSKVVEIAQRHPRMGLHFGKMLKSANGVGRAYTLQELCKCLLPEITITGQNTVSVDTNFDVSIRIQKFIAELNAGYIEHITVWPIRGINTDTPITLDEWTEFRELTVEEKLHCLNFEIIRPQYRESVEPEHSRWFGLCHRKHDAKSFGDTETDTSKFMKRHTELEQILEDFLAAVPLATDQVAYHAGGFHAAPNFEGGGMFSSGTIGRGGMGNDLLFMFNTETEKITDEASAALIATWEFIRGSKTGKFKKRVGNAARRYFYAETRTRKDDALVDLMIAAEALYLDTDKNELRYRMSLNAALWADVSTDMKRQVFKSFKDAYDLRSKVVHGSDASAEIVAECIGLIKPILREGIRKALAHLKLSSDRPNWENMIFPDDLDAGALTGDSTSSMG